MSHDKFKASAYFAPLTHHYTLVENVKCLSNIYSTYVHLISKAYNLGWVQNVHFRIFAIINYHFRKI